MPNYYGGVQGPAQYAQYQQSRKDQQLQSMLRMFMQMRGLKQRRGQWEQEQTTQQEQWGREQERKEASTKSYIQHLEALEAKKPKPNLLDLRTRTAEEMVKKGEWTPDEGRGYIEKGTEPTRLPKNIDKGFASFMAGKYGDDWKDSVESVQFYEEWDDYRKEQQAKGSGADNLKEIRKYYSRQRNTLRQQYIPKIASADPDEKDAARQAMADALEASKKAEQEEIDLVKGIKRQQPKSIPPPELPPGSPGWKESNVPMFGKGGIAEQPSGVTAMRQGNNVVINGTSYPINPDGTVTVNGKKFKIE